MADEDDIKPDAADPAAEAEVVAIAHGGPTGMQFSAASDLPGEPVFLDSIVPDSPAVVAHPRVREGSRLVAVNRVGCSMFNLLL